MCSKGPTVLMIMDGWGWREEAHGNAILQAHTPNFDRLWASCPHAFLTTSGPAVGLPEGQMGNSEVGHLNIGAGRIVTQDLPRIDAAIQDGSLREQLEKSGLSATLERTGGACHILGLSSPGGVHAHHNHLSALARTLGSLGIRVVVHAFTDGRDTQPGLANRYLAELADALPKGAKIATVCGRFYAMDRDNRWERVERAYQAIVQGRGLCVASAREAIRTAMERRETDEFVQPSVIGDYQGFRDGDAILCGNFRSDRVRELLSAILLPDFPGFQRPYRADIVQALGMVSYGGELDRFMHALFPSQMLDEGLSETVSNAGRKQIHLAESEKYPHVTYFLNGGQEEPFKGEERLMIPSPKVSTYDLQPAMSAPELTQETLKAIENGRWDLVVVNFANPDMVGHTGNLTAAIAAVETVDMALGKISGSVEEQGGCLLTIADHGNCEMMIDDEDGAPHTAHTLNLVPVILSGRPDITGLRDGILADVAPTILALMAIEQPKRMTGQSLFVSRA